MYNNLHKEYMQKKYKTMQSYAHLRLGFCSLIQKPACNILLVILIGVFCVAWKYREKWLTAGVFSRGVLQTGAEVFFLLACFMLSLAVILEIGTLRARKVEARLATAFKPQDIRHGTPVLKRKRKAGVDGTIYEFYAAGISLSVWQERKGEIAHVLDIHFIAPYIEYGGKNHSSSKTVLLYTARGQIKSREEPLYEEL